MLALHLQEPAMQAKGVIIWMHGLGADASDMMGLVSQIPLPSLPLRHVFLDAPIRPVTLNAGMSMRAWYDIFDITLNSREDKIGILASQAQLMDVIHAQMDAGFSSDKIILAGFSQGGAMALYTALHANMPLAGVISLSAYLPLYQECAPTLPEETPVFIAGGHFDPLVLPQWTKQSAEWLLSHGYANTALHFYPMEHSICLNEIHDMTQWLLTQFAGVDVV